MCAISPRVHGRIDANLQIGAKKYLYCVEAPYSSISSANGKCLPHTEYSGHRMEIGRPRRSRSEMRPYFPETETFSEYRRGCLMVPEETRWRNFHVYRIFSEFSHVSPFFQYPVACFSLQYKPFHDPFSIMESCLLQHLIPR